MPSTLARLTVLVGACTLWSVAAAQQNGRTRLSGPDPAETAEKPSTPGGIPAWAEPIRDAYLEAQKHGALSLATATSGPGAVGTSEVWVEVTVSALKYAGGEAQPINLALVMDQSASMKGVRLRAEKAAALDLLDHLDDADRLAIIRTSIGVQTLDSAPCTAQNKKKMRDFIDKMEASGNSDISIGFDNAVDQLHPFLEQYQSNHIVLVSDGRLTHGMNDPAGLAQLAKTTREQLKIHISALAIGEDADQDLMAGIAKEGWGVYGYLSDPSRNTFLGRRLKLEFLRRAAERIEVGFKPAPDVAVEDVLGFDEFRDPDAIRVPLYELGPADSVTVRLRLSVTAKKPTPKLPLGTIELVYHDALAESERTVNRELAIAVVKLPKAAAVAQDAAAVSRGLSALAERNLTWAQGAADEGDPLQAIKLVESTQQQLAREQRSLPKLELAEALTRLSAEHDLLAPPKKKAKPKKGKR